MRRADRTARLRLAVAEDPRLTDGFRGTTLGEWRQWLRTPADGTGLPLYHKARKLGELRAEIRAYRGGRLCAAEYMPRLAAKIARFQGWELRERDDLYWLVPATPRTRAIAEGWSLDRLQNEHLCSRIEAAQIHAAIRAIRAEHGDDIGRWAREQAAVAVARELAPLMRYMRPVDGFRSLNRELRRIGADVDLRGLSCPRLDAAIKLAGKLSAKVAQ
jgi:hypothetical protein